MNRLFDQILLLVNIRERGITMLNVFFRKKEKCRIWDREIGVLKSHSRWRVLFAFNICTFKKDRRITMLQWCFNGVVYKNLQNLRTRSWFSDESFTLTFNICTFYKIVPCLWVKNCLDNRHFVNTIWMDFLNKSIYW